MITDCATIDSALKAHFGESCKIRAKHHASGGCINQACRLDLTGGESVFVKENSDRFVDMFATEAQGLIALKVQGGPRLPEPIAVYSGGGTQFIIMTNIFQGSHGKRFWENFGHTFAALHKHRVSDQFGFLKDNYIGSTAQINTRCKSWVEFFGTHRLGYQIRLAAKQGLADSSLVRKTEQLIAKLGDYLPEPEAPSTLHGDLWGGNVMADKDGEAVIYDPACYYGHFEADLAMTELFGRFDQRFYAAYREVTDIPPEYEASRCDIYSLYHVLNHLNLFGSSYASQADGIVSRYAR